jgi:hypothetical protein
MGRRNYSLYAIYGTADHSLYIGHSCWLRARLGRHAAELEKGEHHAPLLEQAYRRSLAAGEPLQVIGLDWDTDETLVKVMEHVLLANSVKFAARWKLANESVPTCAEVKRWHGDGWTKRALERIKVRARPTLARMTPVIPGQITGVLQDYRDFVNRFGPRASEEA